MKPYQDFGLLDWVIAERERRLRASLLMESGVVEMPEEYTTLDVIPESWTETVWHFGRRIRIAVVRSASLTAEAGGVAVGAGSKGSGKEGAPAFR